MHPLVKTNICSLIPAACPGKTTVIRVVSRRKNKPSHLLCKIILYWLQSDHFQTFTPYKSPHVILICCLMTQSRNRLIHSEVRRGYWLPKWVTVRLGRTCVSHIEPWAQGRIHSCIVLYQNWMPLAMWSTLNCHTFEELSLNPTEEGKTDTKQREWARVLFFLAWISILIGNFPGYIAEKPF